VESDKQESEATCAWSGLEIGQGDETVEDHEGQTVLAGVAGVDGCEIDGELYQRDDCVWYEYGDCYVTQEQWDEESVEALDHERYLGSDVRIGETWTGDGVSIPPGDHASNYGYYDCGHCGLLVGEDDAHYHQSDDCIYCPDHVPDDDELMEWDASPLEYGQPVYNGRIASLPNPLALYGLELETECVHCDRSDARHEVESSMYADQQVAICKHDGSLDDETGMEICTVPMGIDDFRRWLPPLVQGLQSMGVRSYDETGGRCGIHVHVNQGAFTGDMHVARFCHLIADPANQELSELIGQRAGNDYAVMRDRKRYRREVVYQTEPMAFDHDTCKYELLPADGPAIPASPHRPLGCDGMGSPYKTEFTEEVAIGRPSIAPYASSTGHYFSANPTCYGTVEVRIYKGTLAKDGAIRAIEHCASALEFTRQCGNTGAYSASYLAWLSERRNEYPALTRFLWRKSADFRAEVRLRYKDSSGYVKAMDKREAEAETQAA